MRRPVPLLMMIALGAAGLALGLAAPAAQGQALAFERVGDFDTDASDLAFAGDTLWAIRTRVWRLPPGETEWEEVTLISASYILPLSTDTLLAGGQHVLRSLNGGQTWDEVYGDGDVLFEAASGALLTGGVNDALGLGLAYSHDRGASWHEAGIDPGWWVPFARAFAEVPPGHPNAGRLLAACWGGMSYSDDDGATWERSGLWEDSSWRYQAYSVAAGEDGRIYAAYYESGVTGLQVAVSADGGQTYAPTYGSGVYRGTGGRILAVPGGADPETGAVLVVHYDGTVWRSDDGAQSFLQVGHVPFLTGGHLEDAVVGPDGRLYVSGAKAGGGEWVYRTKKPVVAAAMTAEAQPVSPPVVIGAGGGTFAYQVRLTNTTTLPQGFQAWSEASGPFSVSPVVGPVALSLAPGASVVKTLVQQVPGRAPGGTYTYTVNAGAFPGSVLSSASFPVVKEGAAEGAGGGEGWAVSGWDEASAVASSAPASLAVSPNPFRGEAAVTLTLGTASEATVALYDVLGRRVAVLHEGALPAGLHRFRLEGAALPAGVYVVRASVGGTAVARTVTLVR